MIDTLQLQISVNIQSKENYGKVPNLDYAVYSPLILFF